jgi:hypothetical protein
MKKAENQAYRRQKRENIPQRPQVFVQMFHRA